MALSNEEKIEIIQQHLKNVEYNVYNITISILEENSVLVPNTISIDALEQQLDDLNSKTTALTAELGKLQ